MKENVNIPIDDTNIIFSIKGNYTDRSNNFYSIEVLYKTWKKYIGKEINWLDGFKRVVTDVNIQGDFIFIDTTKVK
ncbi:MAG: hypothetical protein PHT02_00870 [Tissierellia bacterium]|nr:hypothetical protein [Tissierellia bacterium]